MVGQTVTIDPGTSVAKTATIRAFGSITLSKARQYAHAKGALIVRYTPESLAGGTLTDTPGVSAPATPAAVTALASLAATGASNMGRTTQFVMWLLALGALFLALGIRGRTGAHRWS